MKNLLKSLALSGAEVLTKDQQKRITGGVGCCCPGAGCGTCSGTTCTEKTCGGRSGCEKGKY